MQNGDSIVGQGWFYELVIVPNPSGNNTFYLFSIGVTNSGDSGLYYSVVDMNLNGGLGAVTQKNIRLQPFKIDDGLTAIKHGNGRDWWLFFLVAPTLIQRTSRGSLAGQLPRPSSLVAVMRTGAGKRSVA